MSVKKSRLHGACQKLSAAQVITLANQLAGDFSMNSREVDNPTVIRGGKAHHTG